MKKEVKTGIILILTLGTLIWGVNFLKGKNFFSNTHNYYVIYDDVSGLLESNGVYIKGYKVGHVSKISFSDSTLKQLRVILAIESDIDIPQKSKAKIYSIDIIGNKAVELVFSKENSYLHPNDTLLGAIEVSVSKQLEPYKIQAYNLLNSLDSLSNAVLRAFNPRTLGHLGETIKNIRYTSEAVAESAEDISAALRNIQIITQNFKENNKRISDAIKNFKTVSDSLSEIKFNETVQKLNATLDQSREMIDKLQNNTGTLGKLINNDSLYNNLSKTTTDLDSLINDLKNNPDRYLQFSIFGKSKK